MKIKELSWFHFPLEKSQIARQRIHNCGRVKNRTLIFWGEISLPRMLKIEFEETAACKKIYRAYLHV